MMDFAAHYLWWILALILIGGEILVPGFFLLWIGIAAAVMGVVTLLLPSLGLLPQAVLFAVLAFASCLLWWQWLRPRLGRDDDPASHTMSRRGEQMIGRRYVLSEAIVNGRGKAHVGDGQWLVEGPELPAGAEVRVVGVNGATLKVEAG
ncbi:MAG TPA: NfeD family protein [Rhodanobacteraceae bacterium]|nr:NfeD family protein [Rhodanobacteraceae bacterium]